MTDNWMATFIEVYKSAGLLWKRSRHWGLFSQPLAWTAHFVHLRVATWTTCWNKRGCHDTQPFDESYFVELVCTCWLDKESRAVLGHHCSAVSGSEVVYSRQLQTRALRKLGYILKRVRSGLSLEDPAMRECGIISTPAPCTPVGAARTPIPSGTAPVATESGTVGADQQRVVVDAVNDEVELEELHCKASRMSSWTLRCWKLPPSI